MISMTILFYFYSISINSMFIKNYIYFDTLLVLKKKKKQPKSLLQLVIHKKGAVLVVTWMVYPYHQVQGPQHCQLIICVSLVVTHV